MRIGSQNEVDGWHGNADPIRQPNKHLHAKQFQRRKVLKPTFLTERQKLLKDSNTGKISKQQTKIRLNFSNNAVYWTFSKCAF